MARIMKKTETRNGTPWSRRAGRGAPPRHGVHGDHFERMLHAVGRFVLVGLPAEDAAEEVSSSSAAVPQNICWFMLNMRADDRRFDQAMAGGWWHRRTRACRCRYGSPRRDDFFAHFVLRPVGMAKPRRGRCGRSSWPQRRHDRRRSPAHGGSAPMPACPCCGGAWHCRYRRRVAWSSP